jgi:hypothetical protein
MPLEDKILEIQMLTLLPEMVGKELLSLFILVDLLQELHQKLQIIRLQVVLEQKPRVAGKLI